MYHSAKQMAADYTARFAQPGTVDLQAGSAPKDPDFGGETLDDVQAAGVLSFTSGNTRNVKATEHFLVLGNIVKAGEVVELPSDDARYVINAGKAVDASDEDVAAAQKAAKTK